MTKYKSPLVSCLTCRKEFSAKGIFTHFITSHTEEGRSRVLKNSKVSLKAAVLATKTKAAQLAIDKKIAYDMNPSICDCGKFKPFAARNGIYCSRSCAASHTNKTRPPRTVSDETKKKLSISLIGKQRWCAICYCVVCNVLIRGSFRQSCSPECLSKLRSLNTLNTIKKNKRSNYRRDRQSYLEMSFEKWLIENNISLKWHAEYTIKNHLTNKWYFVDFYFPEINLIVELDGKQHEKHVHKQADIVRDEYITNFLNIKVFRISSKEYRTGSKINSLLELLTTHTF